MSKVKEDLDTVKVMEENEGKRKKKSVEPPKKPSGKRQIERDPIAHDSLAGVPEHHRDKKMKTKDTITSRNVVIEAKDIKAISHYYYVNDIHTANPQVLHEMYWAIMPGHPYVCLPLSKEDATWMRKNTKVEHIIVVVDCSYTPTLSYGWKSTELKGDFPTLEEIAEYDKRLKDNPTHFRNYPVKGVLKATDEIAAAEDDDDFELSLDDDDDDDLVILDDED